MPSKILWTLHFKIFTLLHGTFEKKHCNSFGQIPFLMPPSSLWMNETLVNPSLKLQIFSYSMRPAVVICLKVWQNNYVQWRGMLQVWLLWLIRGSGGDGCGLRQKCSCTILFSTRVLTGAYPWMPAISRPWCLLLKFSLFKHDKLCTLCILDSSFRWMLTNGTTYV